MAVHGESGRAVAPGDAPAAARDCVLGVERSLNGRRWEARLGDARLGLALAQSLELPEVLGRALAAGASILRRRGRSSSRGCATT